ncbi:MAG TPA: MarR family winged helix-turn-helix transcriptional regulator [Mycobacteriales bacterium]|nr:MarR family winged helix-turn-helix transcriptional regulator [Mycobacteriales bacterium]
MNDDRLLRRPIGWWLKEADARLDAAFDASLGVRGVERRVWQVLATIARSAATRREVVAGLASFDALTVVNGVVDDLRERGWVAESPDGMLRLTPAGAREQQALAPLVEDVRHMVAAALPEEDYVTLVRLLARLVEALPETAG